MVLIMSRISTATYWENPTINRNNEVILFPKASKNDTKGTAFIEHKLSELELWRLLKEGISCIIPFQDSLQNKKSTPNKSSKSWIIDKDQTLI